jgi:CBS domain-containing protein
MTLQEILRSKGSDVHTIRPEATLAEVVELLVRFNVGSLVVCQHAEECARGRLLGIITERDILRACAAGHRPLAEQCVMDAMSRRLITGNPQDTVEQAMGLMTENRIRHLPIVTEDELLGIISIGDVVKAQHDDLSLENHYLKSYLQS